MTFKYAITVIILGFSMNSLAQTFTFSSISVEQNSKIILSADLTVSDSYKTLTNLNASSGIQSAQIIAPDNQIQTIILANRICSLFGFRHSSNKPIIKDGGKLNRYSQMAYSGYDLEQNDFFAGNRFKAFSKIICE